MHKTLIALSIAALLSACAMTPDNTLPANELPQTQSPDTANAVNTTWWLQFNDPVLNTLIDTALSNNQDLALATAKIDQARAALGITSSEQLPRIDLGGNAGRQRTAEDASPLGSMTSNNYQLAASASWELDLWGRIRNLTGAAKQDLLASEYNREGVKLIIASEVAQNYFNLRTLDAQLAITNETIKSRQESFKLRNSRFKGGMTSELDVFQAEAELQAAIATKPDIQIAIGKTESALSVLVGQSPQALFSNGIARGLTINQLVTPQDIAPQIDSSLLLRRPDIATAEASLLAQRARIQAARAAYFPRISLTGLLGVQSADLSNLFSSGAQTWAFAGNLAMPLFNNGLTAAQVDQAKAIEQQAAANYQKTVQTAFAETRATLIANQYSADRYQATFKQATALRKQLRISTLRYDNGFSDYLEVLDAQRSLFSTELELAAAQRDLLSYRVSLYKALGGGWQKSTDNKQ